jgi:hypothetical protein
MTEGGPGDMSLGGIDLKTTRFMSDNSNINSLKYISLYM